MKSQGLMNLDIRAKASFLYSVKYLNKFTCEINFPAFIGRFVTTESSQCIKCCDFFPVALVQAHS